MIDHSESGARDYSLSKSDQSPIHSEDISDPRGDTKIFLIRVSHIQTIQNNKMKTPLLTQQYQQTNLLRNILEITTPTRLVHLDDETIGHQLPFRQNRGKPPNRYSPDIGKTSKYPIANHVSTEKLSEPLKAFVHQLSAIHIPTNVLKAWSSKY
ncbi:hypothetical protein L3X38_014680 [Prunus dulcis]|uniref:Uncharacterized protein n=1 Tax=Prunus dulcis TaxID=3755 RepID=A0AAD4WR06_PRUDU|nr:hypothetical protein L3X38_014680 [Prunus dulcis]